MTDTTWEPDWCAACGNIAVSSSGLICDICQNDEGES